MENVRLCESVSQVVATVSHSLRGVTYDDAEARWEILGQLGRELRVPVLASLWNQSVAAWQPFAKGPFEIINVGLGTAEFSAVADDWSSSSCSRTLAAAARLFWVRRYCSAVRPAFVAAYLPLRPFRLIVLYPGGKMAKKPKEEPTQETPARAEIPIPTRKDVSGDLAKVAKPKPKAGREKPPK